MKQILTPRARAHRPQWPDGLRDHDVGPVTVARKLDADETVEVDVTQCPQGFGHVHVAVAEGEVDVVAALHVLQVHVGDVAAELADRLVRLAFAGHEHVAEIERQFHVRHHPNQLGEVVHRGHEHLGLGFERRHEPLCLGIFDDRGRTLVQPLGRVPLVDPRLDPSRPEGQHFGAQDGADVGSALQEVETFGSPLSRSRDEGRLVLLAMVEKEVSAGLDHDAEAEIVDPACAAPGQLRSQSGPRGSK